MKRAAQIVSYVALVATLVPAVLFFADKLELPVAKAWMFGATLVWFLATPVWMEHKATD